MGIWRSAFGIKTIFRWDVFGVLIPSVLLAAGFGVLGVDWFPHNLLISQASFTIAALLILVKTVLFANEEEASNRQRISFAALIGLPTCAIWWLLVTNIERHKTHPESLAFVLLYLHFPWVHDAYWMVVGVITFLLIQKGVMLRVSQLEMRPRHLDAARGLLDWKLQAENAMADLGPAILPITALTKKVGATIERQTSEIQQALSQSTEKQLRVTKNGARRLDALSTRMQTKCLRLETIGHDLQEGLIGWSTWVNGRNNPGDSFATSVPNLPDLCPTISHAIAGTEQFIETLEKSKGISRDMNEALDRHIAVMRRVVAASKNILDACLKALGTGESDGLSVNSGETANGEEGIDE